MTRDEVDAIEARFNDFPPLPRPGGMPAILDPIHIGGRADLAALLAEVRRLHAVEAEHAVMARVFADRALDADEMGDALALARKQGAEEALANIWDTPLSSLPMDSPVTSAHYASGTAGSVLGSIASVNNISVGGGPPV